MTTFVRWCFRQALHQVGSTCFAIAALGIGIGLVVTQYSLIDGILLRNLPFDKSHRLFHLSRTSANGSEPFDLLPVQDYYALQERSTAFEEFAGFSTATFNLGALDRSPQQLSGAFLTANVLQVIGVQPILGRNFLPGEDAPGSPPLILLSHGLWQEYFGGRPEILGQAVKLNGTAATVIGVMEQTFKFPMNNVVLWTNLRQTKEGAMENAPKRLEVIGLLKPNTSLRQARAELTVLNPQLPSHQDIPEERPVPLLLQRFQTAYAGLGTQPLLIIMLAMTLFVLLLACANVSNLLLARASRRTRELAIRSALGATRKRVMAQIFLESLFLASLGGMLGILLSLLGVKLLNIYIVEKMQVPFWFHFSLHFGVLAVALLISAVAGILSALIPAFQAIRFDIFQALKNESNSTSSFTMGRLNRWLVSAQVTLSCALLISASFLAQEVIQLRSIKLTFNPNELMMGRIEIHGDRYPERSDRSLFYRSFIDDLQQIPGIDSVSVSSRDLINPAVNTRIELEAQTYSSERDKPETYLEVVSPEYFNTIGIKAVRGRLFTSQDRINQPVVAVVNQSFVEEFWPGQDPIGKRIRRDGSDEPWATVVGVIPNLYLQGIGGLASSRNSSAGYYLCQDQLGWGWLHLFVRTTLPPQTILPQIREALFSLDPDQPIHALSTLAQQTQTSIQGLQVVGVMTGLFGLAAAGLAMLGVYGVTSFVVGQRTREFGVRIALGATQRNILSLVLGQGIWQLGIGLLVGVLLAFLLIRPIAPYLTEVSTTQPATYLVTTLLLLITSTLALCGPAWRASRVDAMNSLKTD